MKIMVVTGSGGALGRSFVNHFAGLDYKICALDLNKENLTDLVQSNLDRIFSYSCDVSNVDMVKSVFNQIIEEHGQIDVLINNAGIFLQEKRFMKDDFSFIEETIDVNLKGTMFCSYAAAEDMMKREDGYIINIASRAGVIGNSHGPATKDSPMGFGDYFASKHGVMGFAHAFGRDLHAHGIYMTSLCPGGINSGMSEKWDIPKDQLIQPSQMSELIEFILKQEKNIYFKNMLFIPPHEWH